VSEAVVPLRRDSSDPRRFRLIIGTGYLGAAVIDGLAVVGPDPRPEDHHSLLVIAGLNVALGLTLLLGRGLSFGLLRLLGVTAAIVVIALSTAVVDPLGPTMVFYVWPALTAGYFCADGRERLANYAVLTVTLYPALRHNPMGALAVPLTTWLATVMIFVMISGFTHQLVRRDDRLVTQLQRSASTDYLTGLLNRRAWTAAFDREIAAARASGRPLGVAMFDLDHFKLLNDRLGHAAGDQALRGFAEILTRACSPGDLTARSGGEEFAVCLPGRPAAASVRFAAEVAGALRRRSAEEQIALTVSAGVAQLDAVLITSDSLLQAADEALYRAKESGRDRVLAHEPAHRAAAGETPASR
jgi:diguanylate cyclase (GGDEF)-like protein